MKRTHCRTMRKTLGFVCLLTTSLLIGSAVATADVVLDWNAIAMNVGNGANPFFLARYAAITQLAVFEAVNAITGQYHPYLGTIVAPPGASADAAAIQVAYRVLSTYFPASAPTFDAARASSLALIPDGHAARQPQSTIN